MIRSLILIGFTYLLFQLHLTGDISKYINMKYSYLSASAGYALLILTIVQIVMLAKEKPKEQECDHEHCDHNHSKEDKWYKKVIVYPIFFFPILSGLFFPIATLDSNIVTAKGFHFPIYDESKSDPFLQQEFLRPDASIYYNKEDYTAMMAKQKKQYINKKSIVLDDQNFMKGMETIYNYPGEFLGRDVQFMGFAFNDPDSTVEKNQIFLFRFGVIHCIADAGVFGMLVQMPDGVKLKNDQWVSVKGKVSTMYYQPFKTSIPYLKVESWKNVDAPKEQYVYRGY
jgi:putative membrane protein